jgi:hypothetical protein
MSIIQIVILIIPEKIIALYSSFLEEFELKKNKHKPLTNRIIVSKKGVKNNSPIYPIAFIKNKNRIVNAVVFIY